MIKAFYISSTYRPGLVEKRYVRFDLSGRYLWVEADADGSDMRHGWCDADDLPPAIRRLADERAGFFPSYVDWPL